MNLETGPLARFLRPRSIGLTCANRTLFYECSSDVITRNEEDLHKGPEFAEKAAADQVVFFFEAKVELRFLQNVVYAFPFLSVDLRCLSIYNVGR